MADEGLRNHGYCSGMICIDDSKRFEQPSSSQASLTGFEIDEEVMAETHTPFIIARKKRLIGHQLPKPRLSSVLISTSTDGDPVN